MQGYSYQPVRLDTEAVGLEDLIAGAQYLLATLPGGEGRLKKLRFFQEVLYRTSKGTGNTFFTRLLFKITEQGQEAAVAFHNFPITIDKGYAERNFTDEGIGLSLRQLPHFRNTHLFFGHAAQPGSGKVPARIVPAASTVLLVLGIRFPQPL